MMSYLVEPAGVEPVSENAETVLEIFFRRLKITAYVILFINIGGTDMSLNENFLSPVVESFCDIFAYFPAKQEHLKYINTVAECGFYRCLDLRIRFFVEKFATETYSANFWNIPIFSE